MLARGGGVRRRDAFGFGAGLKQGGQVSRGMVVPSTIAESASSAGIQIGQIVINNPVPEKPSESLVKTLRRSNSLLGGRT